MTHDRLIIKRQPPHHRRRFFGIVVLGGAMILGVWGWQMKMTFANYTAERDQAEFEQAFGQVIEIENAETANQQANLDEITSVLQQIIDEQAAKEQVLEQITQTMTEQAQEQAPEAVPAEVTEVPVN